MADKDIDTSSTKKTGIGFDSATLGKESATGAIRKMFDDTKTRKALKNEVTGAKKVEEPSLNDPLSVRDTDTGNLKKMMEDTKTRKTVKLKPLSGRKPIQLNDDIATEKDIATRASARKTVKLKPIEPQTVDGNTSAIPKAAAPTPVSLKAPAGKTTKIGSDTDGTSTIADPLKKRNTNTGAMKKLLDDTKTRKTVKIKHETSSIPKAVVEPIAPKEPTPAGKTAKIGSDTDGTIADPLKKRDTNTGAMKKLLDDTQTRKTVKLRKQGGSTDQQAETVVEGIDTSVGMPSATPGKAQSSQTQKFKARQTQRLKGQSRKSRKAVPGAKETIKLRPAAGGDKAAVQENAKKQTIRMAPIEHGESSDTIKLTKKPKDPNKMPIPAKTANVKKAKVVSSKAKVVGSEILATDTAKKGAFESGIKTAKVVQQAQISPDTAQTIKLDDLGKKASLSLPKRPTMPKKSGAPTAPTQKLSIPDDSEVEQPKPAGLKVKKSEAPKGAGAPIAQKGEEEFGQGDNLKKKKKKSGDASVIYTILAIASIIMLSVATYITAAQYINLWEQERVGKVIPVPVINDFINKIGE